MVAIVPSPTTFGAFSINTFAEAADISRASVYAEIAAGRLRAVKFGGKTLIPAEEAQRWINSLPNFRSADRRAKAGAR